MQIDKIQTTNSNIQNLNFKALKNIKFREGLNTSSYQEQLINALKQSKGAKDFFDRYDGSITFSMDSYFSGLGAKCVETIMSVSYKMKGKLFPLFPQKASIVVADKNLDSSVSDLSRFIKDASYETFETKLLKKDHNAKKIEKINSGIKEQLKNNSFFE